MSATAAICQFTTKPVQKLGRSPPPPRYQQISLDSRQISAATFICWDQGKFPHTRPSAGVPSNLCRIRANFCNRGHLPVCRQVSRFSWSRLFTCVLPRFFRVWADFHDRGYLPLCHQIRIEPEKISATSAVWADFRNRGLLYHQNYYGTQADFRNCSYLVVYNHDSSQFSSFFYSSFKGICLVSALSQRKSSWKLYSLIIMLSIFCFFYFYFAP